MSFDEFKSNVFKDPLLHPVYMVKILNSSEGIGKRIDANVDGDILLNSYIDKLDEEIFINDLVFTNPGVDAVYDGFLWSEIVNELRKHGWVVLQAYSDKYETDEEDDIDDFVIDNDVNYEFKLFTKRNFNNWLTEKDNEGKEIRVGINVTWQDDLGNSFTEDIKFNNEDLAFLFTWKKSNKGRHYADGDLNQAMLTSAYNIRQLNAQLVFSGIVPSFLWLVYGESLKSTTKIKSIFKNVNKSVGIGAKKSVIDSLTSIKTGDCEEILKSLNKQLELFSGITRLPLTFFIPKGESSGLSDVGSKAEMLSVDRKKKYIFNRIKPYMKMFYKYVYGFETDIELPQDLTMESVEEEKPNNKIKTETIIEEEDEQIEKTKAKAKL